MNADFETELAAPPGTYRRTPPFALLNRRLSPHLLWLARPGDALLIDEPWPDRLRSEAQRRGVELVSTETSGRQSAGSERQNARLFTPWGWTPSAVAAGERAGAVVRPVPLDVVARVNSKLWSHALEVESGIALPGAALASTIEELREAIARACPAPDDKWVVKSPYGFAARDRVLGRGPVLEEPQGRWCLRRMARGETLIFQPWLAVVREYGVVAEIAADGSFEVQGISDLQTNGAGTGTGYILGRPPDAGARARVDARRFVGLPAAFPEKATAGRSASTRSNTRAASTRCWKSTRAIQWASSRWPSSSSSSPPRRRSGARKAMMNDERGMMNERQVE